MSVPLARGTVGLAAAIRLLLLGSPPAELTDASACAECHRAQGAEWAASAHGQAWTNPLFAEGFLAEPLMLCVGCHAPLPEQVAQVTVNLPYLRARGPGGPAVLPPHTPQPLADQGVSCPTCHVRTEDAVILAPRDADAPHATELEPRLASGEVCRDCHQFSFHRSDGAPGDTPMQDTWGEWTRWTEATGATDTCVSCHMPAGDHRLHGASDVAALRASVRVYVVSGVYTVEAVGVGHAWPTGDLYRHVTLEEKRGDGWVELARFGRTFRVEDSADGVADKRLATDTRLFPGVPAVVRGLGGPWRLRYHYARDEDEAARRLDPGTLVTVLAEGTGLAEGTAVGTDARPTAR